MRIGICEWSAMAGGEELFRRLQRTGLLGVQVSYETAGFVEKMERYVKWAEQYGVTLTSVGANVFCDRPFFLPENAEWVKETVADVCRGAALTEAKLFHAPSFGASTVHTDEQRHQTAVALQLMCDVAAAYGVTVGTENALSLEENEQLLAAVNRPNLKMYFDTQNPETTSHPDAAAQATAFVSIIPEVHVKDCDETGRSVKLGTGVTGFETTLGNLIRGGYDGWLHLENGYDKFADPEAAMIEEREGLEAILERLCKK